MDLKENELKIAQLENELIACDFESEDFKRIQNELKELKIKTYSNLTAWDKVCIARGEKRIKAKVLIDKLFTSFFELHGDQYFSDDQSIISGIALLDNIPVTVIAQAKGNNITENLKRNFGMTSPEGFRKALRVAKQAEKFNRPIITIVDTSGAYPGKGAEERGQARAIAQNLMEFSKLNVPVISIVLSEGGSGGALALSVSDYIFMFENAVYSILSPEGFTSILFKDTVKVNEACELMKLTSQDLYDMNIIDEIIKEPLGGIRVLNESFVNELKNKLVNKINELNSLTNEELLNNRYNKFRRIGC